MTKKGIFITGTDTDIGKTWFTARLCKALRQRSLDVGIWKPVQSGCLPGEPEADSHQLKSIPELTDEESDICAMSFRAALTPMLAAHMEGKSIDFNELISHHNLLLQKHDILLVEGAGGLAVPLTGDGLVVHLAAKLGYPLLIIARPGLGTINHTLLTVEFARKHGLNVLGIILNGYAGEPERVGSWEELSPGCGLEDSLSTNPCIIEHFCGVPVLGQIPTTRTTGGETVLDNYVQLERIIQTVST